MPAPRRLALAALPLLALAAASCAEKTPRDTAGQAMQLVSTKVDDVSAYPINLTAFFPEGGFGDYTRTERDNGLAYVATVSYRGAQVLSYQWMTGDLALAPNDYAAMGRQSDFEQRLATAGIPYQTGQGTITPVRHPRYPSVGYTYAGPGAAPGTTCFVGRAAYGVRKKSSELFGIGTADAVLSAGLCGAGLDAGRWVRVFNEMSATAP